MARARNDLKAARRHRFLRRALIPLLLVAVASLAAWFAQSTIPRRIVLASGPLDGLHHELAQRYKAILAENGVTVIERATGGAVENAKLLRDPASGVDVAFMLGGVIPPAEQDGLEMLVSIYHAPLWVFYRGDETIAGLDQLRYRRVAIGSPALADRAFIEPLLAANNVTGFNTTFVPIGNLEALRALQAGEVDAICVLGGVSAPTVFQGLHDTNLRLMSVQHSEAYERRFPHITALSLPAGAVSLAPRIPADDVRLFGTVGMLVAREDLAPAITDLLVDAAREVHRGQRYFASRSSFPATDHVDLPVSVEAERHLRFGPSLLQRHLPFFVATYVERLVILLVPVLFLVVPLINWLPQLLRWRARSRVYRWYGELALLERDVARRQGDLPVARWLDDLDRIERAAANIRLPVSMASEGYTLREHIALVRRAIVARTGNADGQGALESPPAS